jgi:hypothetical protein
MLTMHRRAGHTMVQVLKEMAARIDGFYEGAGLA